MANIEDRVSLAVKQFWTVREKQKRKQDESGQTDQGTRGTATGGRHLDGFTALITDLLVEGGTHRDSICSSRTSTILPGHFRATKIWDLVVVHEGRLLAVLELKSHVRSFGNNTNNRSEEAIGNATDLWTAVDGGKFGDSPRPWLGYLMILEEAKKSLRMVKVREPHFKVFEEFRGASYARRYQELLERLVRARLYSEACLILSNREGGSRGEYQQPVPSLGFERFISSLVAHLADHR